MALQYSPKIVQDGLVMCLDASNNKSYPAADLPVKGGLVMWLDAADDTTFSYSSGTVVSQWRDKSGLNNHVGQSTVGSQPNRNVVKNSRKSVYFDGGDTLFNSGNVFPSNTTNYTKIAVVYQTSTATTGNVIGSRTGYDGSNYGHTIYFGGLNFRMWHDTDIVTSSISLSLNTLGIISATYVNSSGLGSVFLNGTASGTGTAANRNIVQNIEIGGLFGGNNYTGEICEALVFSRVLSATELKLVHTYLGQKWGISNTDRSIIDLAGNDDNGLFGNGTVANMPAYDYYNKGTLRFDGSNDYAFLSNSQLNISSTITVEVWVKYNAQGGYNARAYSVITCKGYPWTWLLEDQSGQFNFRISTSVNSDSNVNSSYSHGLNTWNHVVGTYDGASQKIYVDGVLRNSVALTGTINTSSNDALVGLYNYGDYCLTGNVGAVRVYNKALSATEIAQNYEAQKSKFANTIVQQGLILNIDIDNPYSYAGAGATVYDTSITALSWTATNTTYNSSPIKYLSYNGSNSSLVSSTSTAYDSQTITMECWCYPNTLAQSGFLFEKGAVNTQYSMFFNGDGVFYFRTKSISTEDLSFTSSAYLTANAWNHIVCTYGAGTKTVYINGAQGPQQTSLTGTLPTGQTNQYIGKYGALGDNFPFNGRIAESRVYNIALTAAQVLQNYNATRTKYGL